MTPEDAYNEWLLKYGYREVPVDEIFRKGLRETIGYYLHSEGYLKHYPETKSAHYKLKQRHEIKENNEPTT